VHFLWRAPDAWVSPLSLGETSAAVISVADLFARLDGQEGPLARDRFNEALTRRVRLFQQAEGLRDDGVVGVQTLVRLNRALGIDLNSERALRRLDRLQGVR
jgi:general secretion pathway protein A